MTPNNPDLRSAMEHLNNTLQSAGENATIVTLNEAIAAATDALSILTDELESHHKGRK